jgi:hypothetical protein
MPIIISKLHSFRKRTDHRHSIASVYSDLD